MNVSANPLPLILGIGNPLRGDDGLGRVVAEQLAQANDLDCEVQMVHQLTPELAAHMAVATLVVMIDASREGEPGEVRLRPLSSSAQQPGAVGTHYTTPEELDTLTRVLYGHCPPVVIITMTGADFGISEQLSPIVARRLSHINTDVRQVLPSSHPASL
jgi:hydrogenase maturation protease